MGLVLFRILLLLTIPCSLDAIANTFQDAEGRLHVASTLASGFQTHSTEDKANALEWVRTQEDVLVSDTRDVKREDAAPLLATACNREGGEWLLEKYDNRKDVVVSAH